MKQCPTCNSFLDDGAFYCVCGYKFDHYEDSLEELRKIFGMNYEDNKKGQRVRHNS